VAPEYDWDDFKNVDVRGKTLLMLINDPAIPDPKNPSQLDPKLFKGKEMTYYGRWTYKYEIAHAKGAAAAIIIHETIPAAYPFDVVINSNSRERFELKSPDPATSRIQAEGWITFDKARELCAAGGADLTELKKAALRHDFRPVSLKAKANLNVKISYREVVSQNVLGRLEGTDRKHPDETLIYTAHWDHLGRNPALKGDQIYNGALDNASGVAGLLEIARAFTGTKPAPKRSVLFLAVTAEEKGLLGAKFYATHPLYPIEKTVANLNMDGVNPWGRTRDLEIVGRGKSTLEDLLGKELKRQGRRANPDSEPEKGYYYRSDHFQFAKVGVPSLHFGEGTNFVGKAIDFGKKKKEEYTAHDYHAVSDEIKPDWDFSGGAEDLEALYQLGLRIAQRKATPDWKKGAEFSRSPKQ
jgi:Zn-dependent M28 family amino/carboxypeptidase